ncbi:Hypothetical predicted protein [Olea europaea subsp. europaea]|uniref:Uncharacterized protein n=1 Tax=Olea europaea subsp. europaea TaxID=158383 RepID=A0A8S0PCH6_OLEEU|nr:Hypothetical predicted protein [Olea europaea subsp. europaea]
MQFKGSWRRQKVAASTSTDTKNSAAYETSKYASEKANDAADTTSEKISGTKIYASKEGQEINMASDMAESGKG